MTIKDIVRGLDSIQERMTIYAQPKATWNRDQDDQIRWSPESLAVLVAQESDPEDDKYLYCLEISIVKEVLEAWSHMREGRTATLEEKCEAILHYAEFDSYLMPEGSEE
jgi:hypothetical protein